MECDSARQATSQVQRRSRDVGGSPERPCLARGDCCPPGKGCNRAGPSSRDEAGFLQPLLHRAQERWTWGDLWPILDCESWTGLCTSSRSRCWRTSAWSKHSAPGIGLQRSTLKDAYFHVSILPRHQTVSTVCVRRSGMAVQGPPLLALPVSPCVHEVVEGALNPLREVGVRILKRPRRLAYPSPIKRAVGRSQGLGAPAPQPVGASGQLGKEQALPFAGEYLFSVWS